MPPLSEVNTTSVFSRYPVLFHHGDDPADGVVHVLDAGGVLPAEFLDVLVGLEPLGRLVERDDAPP